MSPSPPTLPKIFFADADATPDFFLSILGVSSTDRMRDLDWLYRASLFLPASERGGPASKRPRLACGGGVRSSCRAKVTAVGSGKRRLLPLSLKMLLLLALGSAAVVEVKETSWLIILVVPWMEVSLPALNRPEREFVVNKKVFKLQISNCFLPVMPALCPLGLKGVNASAALVAHEYSSLLLLSISSLMLDAWVTGSEMLGAFREWISSAERGTGRVRAGRGKATVNRLDGLRAADVGFKL